MVTVMVQFKLSCFLLTAWLLGTIATRLKRDQPSKTPEEYEIVYPKILRSENIRNRRSAFAENNDYFNEYEIPIYLEIKNWTWRTVSNDRLIFSDNFTVDWVYATGIKNHQPSKHCDLRYGSLNDVSEGSFIVLSICKNEVYGLMLVNERTFFLQPSIGDQHILYESETTKWRASRNEGILSLEKFNDEVSGGKKGKEYNKGIIGKKVRRRKRRQAVTEPIREFYNLSSDVFGMEDLDVEMLTLYDDKEPAEKEIPVTEEYHFEEDSKLNDYFIGLQSYRNKTLRMKVLKQFSPRWLELGVAADYSVVGFHGSRAQQYILTLLNIVSAIFMDPSLESNMVLVIVRMILYAEKGDSMVRHGDARRSLENVNKWNRRMLLAGESKHDIAVWLTRLDIGGPSGYAPVSGVCDPTRSCALNRDEGLTSAFIIAHELAHILGLTHDGDEATGNNCIDEAKRGSVMAPMVAATFHHFYWSTCSRKEFHRKIKRWGCLLNQPSDTASTELETKFKGIFTMDEQCRMEFGEGYEMCKTYNIKDICSRLWCRNNTSQTCRTKKGPPLDGTECGESKWCINGHCEQVDINKLDLKIAQHAPRDGSWSPWGPWSKCSRSCSLGVQCRLRKCNKPPPLYGGKYCSGRNQDCKLCILPQCSTFFDLRLQQCSKLSSLQYFENILAKNNNSIWLPYQTEQTSLKCQLICKNKETGEIFYTRQNLIDGTPCSYDTTDICIQGECHRMGCDNVLGSTKKFDVCGVCDGNGTNCEYVLNTFQRKLRREITRIAVIPREAHNMLMNVTYARDGLIVQSNLSIIVAEGRKKYNRENTIISRKRNTTVILGAAFEVTKVSNNNYTIREIGSTFEDVVVLVIVDKQTAEIGITVSISMQYFVNVRELATRSRYVWRFGGWSFCSVSCGGGVRRKMILCKDEKTNKVVSRRKCSVTTKPGHASERCNTFSCNFKWLPGPWEVCSTTCGNSGIQLRQLYCVHTDFTGTEINKSNELEVYETMVHSSVCQNNTKPSTKRPCNRTTCSGHWTLVDWLSVKNIKFHLSDLGSYHKKCTFRRKIEGSDIYD